MVVRGQREGTVTRRFRDESLVIDMIRQLKASACLSHVPCLFVRSTLAFLTVSLLGSLLDLRDDPILSAASVKDFLDGICDLRFLSKARPRR